MGFLYSSPWTINSGQVPSTQTDFPLLFSVTDSRFKHTSFGGHVANINGYDLRPYDSALVTPATFELERYTPSTGEVVMHVKRSSVLDGLITGFQYGDVSLTTDGSSPSTWSNSFIDVYHFKDGTTLSAVNATGGTALTFAGHGPTAAAGIIDGAASFASASSQYAAGYNNHSNAITYSIWVKAVSFPGAYNDPIIKINGSGTFFNLICVKSTGKMRWCVAATTNLDQDGTGLNTLVTGTWYYLVLTYDSTVGLTGYVNASVDKTATANGVCSNTGTSFDIGATSIFNSQFWNGSLDEARFASVARSASWITTEFNNQNNPSAFGTLGSELGGPVQGFVCGAG